MRRKDNFEKSRHDYEQEGKYKLKEELMLKTNEELIKELEQKEMELVNLRYYRIVFDKVFRDLKELLKDLEGKVDNN